MKAPEPEPGGVVLDATGWYWLRRYMTAQAAEAQWKADRLEARDRLIGIMKDYQYGHHNGQRVMSVVRARPRTFNLTAFAEDHPALAEQYREEQVEQVRIVPVKDVLIEHTLIEPAEAERGGAS